MIKIEILVIVILCKYEKIYFLINIQKLMSCKKINNEWR